jgi:succinyl-diaminopimelate desuccinylase
MEKYFDRIVESIRGVVKFDSSFAPTEEGAPFGKTTLACLEYFLSLAKEMGFETHNYDGYVGEVTYGEGKEFALLAHLDVVPAGNGWKYPPFDGVIADGKLYGRGTMDDKGPAVVLLYCLYALKEEGILPKRKFKLIVGCNEETGWACMEHYKKVAPMPEEGFTPDADFPVIYAEKGIAHITLTFPVKNAPFSGMGGGNAANMVCDLAFATPKNRVELKGYKNPVKDTSLAVENGQLVSHGVSAHGSTPEKGANALQALLAYFAKENEDCQKAYAVLFADSLGLKAMHDVTGYLTMSPDVVRYADGALQVTVDFRYPSTHKLSEITDKLQAAGVAFTVGHHQEPLFNDPDGELIQTLLGVYNRVTGKKATPIAIGGGTYARVLKCGCGFGPEDEGEESTIHQPNEYITLDKIKQLSEIYYLALKELGK